MARHIDNEQGSILLLSLIILACVTITGISALNITSVEQQIAGADRRNLVFHQNAEAALNYAMATFYKIYENKDANGDAIYTHDEDYVTELQKYDSLSDSTTALKHILPSMAAVVFSYRMKDDAGLDTGDPLALIEVRCVTKVDDMLQDENLSESKDNMPIVSTVLTPAAVLTPKISHISPAPKGYDKTVHCSRLFAITATALNPITGETTNIILQEGYYVPEEKEKYKTWEVY